ncbi:DUF4232 domain-containing protein [Streptomyces sp. DH12]|uniref:DUF4232 domain-containing protein n=1 Tax=Streptomyces sp. DH12 TaxID=2857010 RepID=UPI001E43CA18|nr:DUF4232 domain-containing protein [Streptomyces sp. DH12]
MARLFPRRAALLVAGLMAASTAPAVAVSPDVTGRPAPCKDSALAPSWAPGGSAKPEGVPGEQVTAVVALKNTGSHACALRGYPEVTLKMGTETEGVQTETFRDQTSVRPKPVTLAPGASARFTLTFLSSKVSEDDVIVPGVAEITVPAGKSPKELKWRWGPVMRQEAATHSGNFVSPVTK